MRNSILCSHKEFVLWKTVLVVEGRGLGLHTDCVCLLRGGCRDEGCSLDVCLSSCSFKVCGLVDLLSKIRG